MNLSNVIVLKFFSSPSTWARPTTYRKKKKKIVVFDTHTLKIYGSWYSK